MTAFRDQELQRGRLFHPAIFYGPQQEEKIMSAKRALILVRRGRPRKIAERYPSGDVKRRERGDPRDLGIYNRCKESRSRYWQDRALESEIGRLHQGQKRINPTQTDP